MPAKVRLAAAKVALIVLLRGGSVLVKFFEGCGRLVHSSPNLSARVRKDIVSK